MFKVTFSHLNTLTLPAIFYIDAPSRRRAIELGFMECELHYRGHSQFVEKVTVETLPFGLKDVVKDDPHRVA